MKRIITLISLSLLMTGILCANTYSTLSTNFENGKNDRNSESVTNIPNLIFYDGFFSLNLPFALPVVDSFSPTSSCMGNVITIYGSGFTGTTSVSIGGTNCAFFTVNSDTQITAVVGNGTTGLVAVTNSVGTGTSIGMFYFTSSPAMPGPITGNTSVCPGSIQTYSISSVTLATDYTWTLPNGWTGSSTTTAITTTAGISSGSITVTANDSCGSSGAQILNVVSDTIPPTAICQSITVYLDNSGNATIMGSDIDYGSFDNVGILGETASPSSFSCADIGVNTAILMVIDVCGNTSTCSTTVTVQDNIPASPCPIYPDSFAMAGNVITYWVDTVAGATSYTWTLPSGWSGTTTTNSITATVGAGSGIICVVANSACGSSGACCMQVSVVNCYAAFNLYADTSILHHYFITDTVMGIQPFQYLWSWGDGNFDTIAYPSHTYADTGIYTICLTITDSTGCQSTFCDSSYDVMRTSNTMATIDVINPYLMTPTKITDSKNVISIYPNPASSTITFHQSIPSTNQQLLITNILGEEIYHQPINNSTQTTIDIFQWSNGVYFYQIRGDKETLQGKFVKQ